MAFSDQTKREISFKKLVGRDHTSNAKEFFEEFPGGGFNVHADEVWSGTIPLTAPAFTTSVVKVFTDLALTEDVTVDDQRGWEALDSAIRLRDWIPPKFGQTYTVRLFSDDGYGSLGEEIASGDPINWFFDYETGFLAIENAFTTGRPAPDLPTIITPFHIQGFLYQGETVSTTAGIDGATGAAGPQGPTVGGRMVFIENPTAIDEIAIGFFCDSVVVSEIFGQTDDGTVDFNVYYQGQTGPASTGTAIASTGVIADTDGTTHTEWNSNIIPANSWITFRANDTGTGPSGGDGPTKLWVSVCFD